MTYLVCAACRHPHAHASDGPDGPCAMCPRCQAERRAAGGKK